MIVGAKEFIEESQMKFKGIQTDIAELEKTITELESQIDTENEFKVDTLKKNRAIQSELNMYKTALEKAFRKRDEIRREVSKNSYSKLTDLIRAHRREQRTSVDKKNLAIIQKVEEIRKLHAEIQEHDRAIEQEISGFIDQAEQYLNPEPQKNLILFGQSKTQADYLKHVHSKNFLNGGTTFVNDVSEYVLGIKGGLYEVTQSVQGRMDELKESLKG